MAINEEVRPERAKNRRSLGAGLPHQSNLRSWLASFSAEHGGHDHKRRRKIATYVGACFSLGIAALAIFVLIHTLAHINPGQLRAAFDATENSQIFAALGLTALSFLALTGYDGVALLQLRQKVPYSTTALASFTSYAICFTLGFPLITAGTVRFWIYSQAGVSPSKIASLTIIAGVTYWLGMALILGIGLIFRAEMIGQLDHLSPQLNMLIGAGILGALIVYLIWVSIEHRWTRIQGFKLELPGFKLTLAQIVLSVIDLCAAAGVLYALLPTPRGIDFFTFAAVYVFACALGIASYAPGGIGVFEATMLKVLPVPSQEGLLASLLLFRIIYYLIPFILAFALLGANEGGRRWSGLREAMQRASAASTDKDAE
jgi:glycosyltransferase 2 family protein